MRLKRSSKNSNSKIVVCQQNLHCRHATVCHGDVAMTVPVLTLVQHPEVELTVISRPF
jgi:hypothetical protein